MNGVLIRAFKRRLNACRMPMSPNLLLTTLAYFIDSIAELRSISGWMRIEDQRIGGKPRRKTQFLSSQHSCIIKRIHL